MALMRVRALMVPPGNPDFMTRARLVKAGSVTLTGRALGPVTSSTCAPFHVLFSVGPLG